MLDRVTFTGADDSIEPEDLAEISKQYPFVEWGILFSKSQQGTPRCPSERWLRKFAAVMIQNPAAQLSAHLCGRWVREFVLNGDYSFGGYVIDELQVAGLFD